MNDREMVSQRLHADARSIEQLEWEGGHAMHRPLFEAHAHADARIEHRISMWLDANLDVDTRHAHIRIDRGVVHLEGFMNDRESRNTLVEAIRGLEGVTRIEDDLDIRHRDPSWTPPPPR